MKDKASLIRQCQQVLDALGLNFQCGGEVEWYNITSNFHGFSHPETVRQEILDTLLTHPKLFTAIPKAYNIEQVNTWMEGGMSEQAALKKSMRERVYELFHPPVDREEQADAAQLLLLCRILKKAGREGIEIEKFSQENGRIPHEDAQQFEIATRTTSPEQLPAWLGRLREIAKEEAATLDIITDFRAKPKYTLGQNNASFPGSGIHIHYGLTDAEGDNALNTMQNAPNALSKICADGVLLATRHGGLKLVSSGDETASDRLPSEHMENGDKYISTAHHKKGAVRHVQPDHPNYHQEFRGPGAACDPQDAVLVPLLGTVFGIAHALSITPNKGLARLWQTRGRADDAGQTMAQIHQAITPAMYDTISEMMEREIAPAIECDAPDHSHAWAAQSAKTMAQLEATPHRAHPRVS